VKHHGCSSRYLDTWRAPPDILSIASAESSPQTSRGLCTSRGCWYGVGQSDSPPPACRGRRWTNTRDSLCWRGGRIKGSVIMIDDVYTHGRISIACRQLLTEAGTRDIVLGCLSLTQS
jgi:hypothetical protein